MANRFIRLIPPGPPPRGPREGPADFALWQWERRMQRLAEGAADAPSTNPARPFHRDYFEH